ncbi:MAG: PilN domain-containing protein [Hyphomicrobiales bacterium]
MSDVPAIDRYDNSATRQVLALGGRLARRIRTYIDALIADLANEGGTAPAWRQLIHLGGGKAQIYGRNKAGAPELIGSFEGAIPAKLRTKLARGKRIHLRLGRERAVVQTLSLPEGAREVLAAVVRNKVESLAPWPLEEAVWGYRETAESQPGHIGVEIGIASRRTVEALLAALAASGIRADRLDIGANAPAEDGIAIDFHSAARLERARNLLKTSLAGAATVAAAVFAAGLYMALSAQAELTAVEQRSEALSRALKQGPAGAAAAGKLAFANSIHERKKNERPLIAVLNTLTALVPDGIFLNALDYEDNAVTLTGRGTGASGVIGLLEASDVFAAAAFSSATQRDPNSNAEVFSISATIEAPGAAP